MQLLEYVMSQNSTPPLELPPDWNNRGSSSLANVNRSIPTPVASFTFNNSRPFTMGTQSNNRTPILRRVPKTRRKSTPLTSENIRRKLHKNKLYKLWSNEIINNSSKKRKLTFSPNTKNEDPANANTQPLNGGRRRRTQRKKHHKTRRCRR